MKKGLRILALMLIVIAAILFGYNAMGLVTERSFEKVIADVRKTRGLDLKVVQYQRHIFSAKATIEWLIKLPEREVKNPDGSIRLVEETDYLLSVPLSVFHGPLIVSQHGLHLGFGYANAEVDLPEKLKQQFSALFTPNSVYPQLKVSVLINFLNQAKITANIPEFHLNLASNMGHIEWLGLTSTTIFSLNLSKISGDLHLKGIHFLQGETKMALDKAASEYNLTRTHLGLYDGMSRLTLKSFAISNHEKTQFELKKLLLSNENRENDGLLDAHLLAKLKQITLETRSYGPGELNLDIKHLDATTLSKIQKQLSMLKQQKMIGQGQAWLTVLPSLPELFAKGASIQLSDLSFGLPSGKIQGHLSLSLPKDSNTASNPFQIFSHLVGEGQLSAPTALVRELLEEGVREQLNQREQQQNNGATALPAKDAALEQSLNHFVDRRITSLVSSGALVKEGDDFTVDVKLEHGRITINGKPFSPAMLTF